MRVEISKHGISRFVTTSTTICYIHVCKLMQLHSLCVFKALSCCDQLVRCLLRVYFHEQRKLLDLSILEKRKLYVSSPDC